MLKDFASQQGKIVNCLGDWVIELMRIGQLSGNSDNSGFAIPNLLYPIYEGRQAFFTLADSEISVVQ